MTHLVLGTFLPAQYGYGLQAARNVPQGATLHLSLQLFNPIEGSQHLAALLPHPLTIAKSERAMSPRHSPFFYYIDPTS